jgi:hypothetical protein
MQPFCRPNQIGERGNPHFTHHLAPMHFDRNLGNSELIANLLVQPTAGHQIHYLSLPRGQRVIPCPKSTELFLFCKTIAAALEAFNDRIQ